MKKISKLSFFLVSLLLFFSVSFAQARNIPACPYVFTKDLRIGSTDGDIQVLQQVLNSDIRTKIADTGAGSPGQETDYFGNATRSALKRFQALFIEYIGVADGAFNEKTRMVAQQVCNQVNGINEGFDNVQQEMPSEAPQTNVVPTGPLEIQLTPNTNEVTIKEILKVVVDLNKEVVELTPDSIIIDGGTVKEIRKLSRTKYTVLITPNEDAKLIDIQVEATRVTAKDGSTNENASNGLEIDIIGGSITSTGAIDDTLGNILNSIIASNTAATTQTQNCYGALVPIGSPCVNPNQATQAAQTPDTGNSMLMQMLPGLMKALGGGGSGGQQSQSGGQQSNNGSSNPYGNNSKVDPDGNGQVPRTGDTNKCGKEVASDAEFRGLLKAAGIEIAGGSFNGELKDGALMLKELQTDCNCKLKVTSGIRPGRAAGTAHGPQTRSFDVGYSTELLALLKSKGSGGQCWYTYKGIRFLDEQVCPSKGATGPHWHIEGNGWQCSK